jgi:hypothetical protein
MVSLTFPTFSQLRNPRTPVSPARIFFKKINPIIRFNEESNLDGCDHTSAPLTN